MDKPIDSPDWRSRSWICCALANSALSLSTVEIARRCRVGRPPPSARPVCSVLVIVASVRRVAVSVVDVVDVVAVLDGRVTTAGPVLVLVAVPDRLVLGDC